MSERYKWKAALVAAFLFILGIQLPVTHASMSVSPVRIDLNDEHRKDVIRVSNPEETAKTIRNGWLMTGDIGHRDEDGYLFLTDRLKDVIICSGFKVYPRIIEDAFYRHPDVDEVTVIGIPDDYRGETPKAYVKLKDGASANEAELLSFVEKILNPIEHPAEIEFRDELPKTMIGKLSKKELVSEHREMREALHHG